jgi:hypothetical protein
MLETERQFRPSVTSVIDTQRAKSEGRQAEHGKARAAISITSKLDWPPLTAFGSGASGLCPTVMIVGEVTKPETINYRTLKPEMDGLVL